MIYVFKLEKNGIGHGWETYDTSVQGDASDNLVDTCGILNKIRFIWKKLFKYDNF